MQKHVILQQPLSRTDSTIEQLKKQNTNQSHAPDASGRLWFVFGYFWCLWALPLQSNIGMGLLQIFVLLQQPLFLYVFLKPFEFLIREGFGIFPGVLVMILFHRDTLFHTDLRGFLLILCI